MRRSPARPGDAWAMLAYASCVTGYNEGIILSDWTYKVLKEKVPLLVFSGVDIRQNGKLFSFGPSSHEDEVATATGARFLQNHVDRMVNMIRGEFEPDPRRISPALVQEARATFEGVIKVEMPYFAPVIGMSDMANAIRNGACKAISTLSPQKWKICWAHVWRAVTNNMSKLNDASAERKDEAFTDLAFIHEVWGTTFREHAIRMFTTKWRDERGEESFVTYLEKHIFIYNFSRTGEPGEVSDGNTIERMNLALKGEGRGVLQRCRGHGHDAQARRRRRQPVLP